MIIKKLGALLLTAIIALTLVITPVISATQDNTVLQGKTCNSTDNCKKTELRPDFVNSLSLNKVPIGHVNELHVTKKQYTGCTIELLCINKKGKWEYVGGESIYLDIYNSHGQIIWSTKKYPGIGEWNRFYLPRFSIGNYTMKFIYPGSRKHHLLPCNKTIPLYVE